MAAAVTPRRPGPAPSISHTRTGKVMNRTGHALKGAIASAEIAPMETAIAARRQPQLRMGARAAERRTSAALMYPSLHPAVSSAWVTRALRAHHAFARRGRDARSLLPFAGRY